MIPGAGGPSDKSKKPGAAKPVAAKPIAAPAVAKPAAARTPSNPKKMANTMGTDLDALSRRIRPATATDEELVHLLDVDNGFSPTATPTASSTASTILGVDDASELDSVGGDNDDDNTQLTEESNLDEVLQMHHENAPMLTMRSKGPAEANLNTAKAELYEQFYDDLDDEQQAKHDNDYADDNVYQLLIAALNNSKDNSLVQGQTANFVHQLNRAIPYFELAYMKAQKEYKDASAKDKKPGSDAYNRLAAMKEMHDMLQTLRSLAHNNIRFSPEQYQEKLVDLRRVLVAAGQDPSAMNVAFNKVVNDQLHSLNDRRFYQSVSYGSTSYHAGSNSNELLSKYKTRMVIMDEGKPKNEPQSISLQLNYSRSLGIGTRFKHSKHFVALSSDNSLAQLERSIKDAVTAIINDYDKGSEKNPINIKWTPEEVNRSDEALALLMQFKQWAMENQEPRYAMLGKRKILIQPNAEFSPQERELFLHYAKKTPSSKGVWGIKEANHCAGYKLYKNQIDDEGNRIMPKGKDRNDADFDDMMIKVMETRLHRLDKQDKANLLSRVNEANSHPPKITQPEGLVLGTQRPTT